MDTKALRQKILDLAIRGKLVPQDSNDEPASILLEHIRQQKQQMVKDGKLKAKDIKNDTVIFVGEDNLHYEKFQDGSVKYIEDEIPFELPEGWAWARLGTVFSTVTGATPSTKDASLYGTDYPFYKPTDLDAGYNVCGAEDSVSEKGYLSGRPLPKFSVLVTCIGATIGKTGYISNAGICNQQINAVLPNSEVLSDYTYFCMCSRYEQQQIWTNSSATTLPILNKSKFDNLLFPIPPHEQQAQIVERIKGLFSFVEKIQSNQESLKTTVAIAKSKILDLAIRGKLVPQDPNDEPASILLERIRAEKEELIKQGKIKRDKKESIIFKGEDNSYYEKIGSEMRCIDSEIPFDLPESWIFTRLKHIGEVIGGGTPKTNIDEYWDGNIPWLTPADLSGYEDVYILTGARTITELGLKSSSAQMLPKNSILYSSRAPIGYIAIAANPISTNQGFKSVVPYNFAMSPYLYYCLKARTSDIVQRATGTTFKEISGSEMAETIIPLPPIDEQQRIFDKVTQLLEALSTIEKSLN